MLEGVGVTDELPLDGVGVGTGGAIPPSLPVVPNLVSPVGRPEPSFGVAGIGFV